MRLQYLALVGILSWSLLACGESSDKSKDSTPGEDLSGQEDLTLDTAPLDTLEDTLPQDAAPMDTVDTLEAGTLPDSLLEELADEDTIQAVDTPQVDTVQGPASSCRSEAGEFTASCEYYWDTNTNVAAKQELCESTQRTWDSGNICLEGALGYCEEPSEQITYYCYPAEGMSDEDKLAFCQMACGGTFETIEPTL